MSFNLLYFKSIGILLLFSYGYWMLLALLFVIFRVFFILFFFTRFQFSSCFRWKWKKHWICHEFMLCFLLLLNRSLFISSFIFVGCVFICIFRSSFVFEIEWSLLFIFFLLWLLQQIESIVLCVSFIHDSLTHKIIYSNDRKQSNNYILYDVRCASRPMEKCLQFSWNVAFV